MKRQRGVVMDPAVAVGDRNLRIAVDAHSLRRDLATVHTERDAILARQHERTVLARVERLMPQIPIDAARAGASRALQLLAREFADDRAGRVADAQGQLLRHVRQPKRDGGARLPVLAPESPIARVARMLIRRIEL